MLEWHVTEALIRLGAVDQALQRLRERYGYIRRGSYTLGEHWGPANHGYAAGPLAILSGRIAGIRPLEPGYARIGIHPNLGELTHVACTAPSPAGAISVTVARAADGAWSLEALVPKPAVLTVPRNACGPAGMGTIVDGQGRRWWPAVTATLPNGVSSGDGDDHAVRFQVPAGRWTLHAVPPENRSP